MTWDQCAARYETAEEMLAGVRDVRSRLRPQITPMVRIEPVKAVYEENTDAIPKPVDSHQIIDGIALVWKGGREWLIVSSDEPFLSSETKMERAAMEDPILPAWLKGPKGEMPKAADDIIRRVASHHGFTKTEMLSPRRLAKMVVARHEAMWWLTRLSGQSLQSVGRMLGGMDHTTVLNGLRKHQFRIDAGEA